MTTTIQFALRLLFAAALNRFTAVRAESSGVIDGLIIDAPEFVTAPTAQPSVTSEGDYRPGIGRAWPASGRFGGRGHIDGVLDWDIGKFGVIEKGHLAAHPLNASHQPWSLRLAPADATDPPTAPDYRVRWLSVESTARFGAVEVRTTYSLGSPGLLVETAAAALRIDFSDTPRFAVLPLRGGATVRAVSPPASLYDRQRDGALADNWILLCGTAAFPDVPVLLVLRDSPAHITARVATAAARGGSLTIATSNGIGHLVLATPYGMNALVPNRDTELAQLRDAVARSRFWSKALLGFVVDATEDYRIDERAGTVAIRQRFVYRDLADAWGSRPRHLAPVPPALVLAAQVAPDIKLPAATTDLHFATRHGLLLAALDRTEIEYVLPTPPVASRTPLASTGELPARDAVRRMHRIVPQNGERPLVASEFPGFWNRPDRPVVDVVAPANELAFLWPQLDADSRRALKSNWRSLLLDSLDDDAAFRQTELFRSIVRTPGHSEAKLVRPIWFPRTEVATGTRYRLSYTVPNVRKEGKSVTDYAGSFTDCEWGNGLGLWGIYQLARVSGDWTAVKRNWPLLDDVYALFRVQQDWATMTASGSENGRRWTDTSCYGGYIGYREMARRMGADAAWRDAIYLHARHAALRLALLQFGTWNAEWTGFRPFRVAHQMQEHNRGFRNPMEPLQYAVPADFRGEPIAIARGTFYSLVAEGTGAECPDLLYSLAPRVTGEIVRAYDREFPEWTSPEFVAAMSARHSPSGGITLYEMFLFQLRDPALATAEIARKFATAGGADAIRRSLGQRGHYGRFGAAAEYAQALLETRDDPAWLIDWEGGDLLSADFDRLAQQAHFAISGGPWKIALGGRPPVSTRYEAPAAGELQCREQHGQWIIAGEHPGQIVVRY